MSIPRVHLGRVATSIDYGLTASAATEPIGPKFLRITDIQNGSVDWDEVPWCTAGSKAIGGAQLRGGDIVFARTGATTGKSFLVSSCPPNTVFASYLIRVRLAETADPGYVSHFFQTADYWGQITKGARGVAQPGVNATTLKSLTLPLPPLPEQKRIAAILDAADALRAKRREALAQLDTLLQSTFLDMFGDPVTNPMGWPETTLDRVGNFVSGGTPSKSREDYWSGSTPWVSPKDMKVRRLFDAEDHVSESAFAETSLKRLEPGHLLIVVRGMILAHSFPVAINQVPVGINQDMKAIRPSGQFDVVFLLECLRHLTRKIVAEASSAGHGTKRFDAEAMKRINVQRPALDLQRSFTRIVDTIERQRASQRAHLAKLDLLFASLQSRAFEGAL